MANEINPNLGVYRSEVKRGQNESKVNTKKGTVKIDKIPDWAKDLFTVTNIEQIKNKDGTVTTKRTYGYGGTLETTKRKDENGNEYEEHIQKYPSGNIQAKTIKNNESETGNYYDKNGNFMMKITKNFDKDGKTVISDSNINYATDKNGKTSVSAEIHRYENGDITEAYYNLPPDNKSKATIKTKENGKAVEKDYDMTDVNINRGEIKLDEKGNIITNDGIKPRITRKITDRGLPTEELSEYEYKSDGTIVETITDANGNKKTKYYDNEKDFENGVNTSAKH